MAANYYVDSDPAVGDDSHDGTDPTSAHAWRTLGHAITTLLSAPVTQSLVINLAGTQAAPKTYAGAGLSGVVCVGGRSVTIQPTPCSQSEVPYANYQAGLDPFSTATPAPKIDIENGQRPCVVTGGVGIISGSGVTFFGVEFQGTGASGGSATSPTVYMDFGSALFRYCQFSGDQGPTSVGVIAINDSTVMFENCAVADYHTGALIADGSALQLTGNNWFDDCGAYGIAVTNGEVLVEPWQSGAPGFHVTTIQTSSPRAAYTAVWASASKVIISDLTKFGVQHRGQIQIIKNDLHGNDEYYGVVLEAQSLLLGHKLVMFTNPALAVTQPAFHTVPKVRQIVKAAGEGCIATD